MSDVETKILLQKFDEIPRDAEGPVFSEPWEAEAFAMTLCAYEQGLFTWPEWAACLTTAIACAQRDGDRDLGDTYYHHWLTALENILVEKSITDRVELDALYSAWDSAARSTPHGQPITIER